MHCKMALKSNKVSFLFVVGMLLVTGLFSVVTTQAESGTAIIIDNGTIGTDLKGTNTYASGTWKKSTSSACKGYNDSSSLYSETPGAYYKWFKTIDKGEYEVFIYKILGKGDTAAAIEVGEGTKVLGTTTLNYTTGTPSGWVSLGVFSFDGTSEAYVKNTLSSKGTLTRADAVKFERAGEASSAPVSTVTPQPTSKPAVDNVTAGKPEGISVKINGKLQSYDQPPVVVNDRTMVPLRGIFEALGAGISWDETTETVTANKEEITIVLKIGDSKAFVNGNEKVLDQPAQLINGRTLVPVRFISEAMGAQVDWDEKNQTVVITVVGDDKSAVSTENGVKKKTIENANVVAFGDSLTKIMKWPDVIKERFNLNLVNAGVSGNTSTQGLTRIQDDVLKYNPDFVIINFGMNDHVMSGDNKPKVDIDTFRNNMTSIVNQVKGIGAIPILVTTNYIIEGDSKSYYYGRHNPSWYEQVGGAQAFLDKYIEVVREVGAAEKVDIIDIRKECDKYDRYDFLASLKNGSKDDGVHLSELGRSVYAKVIGDFLEQNYE